MAELDAKTIIEMVEGYCKPPSTSSGALPIVSTKKTNATSKFKDENNTQGSTNISIYATGLAANSDTLLKKSNMTISHACDSSTYVGGMIKQVGVYGGRIVRAIRDAIQAILRGLGFSPSTSGYVSKLQYFAQWLKDRIDELKEIRDFLQGYIVFIADVRKAIAYILSLPVCLLKYFQDCLVELRKQLVAGFQQALAGVGNPSDAALKEASDALKDTQKSIDDGIKQVKETVATAGDLVKEATGLTGDIISAPATLVSAASAAASSAAASVMSSVTDMSGVASTITTANPTNLAASQVSSFNTTPSMA